MTRPHRIAGSIALAVFVGVCVAEAAPGDKPGWELTFQDEFDGTALDLGKWKRRYKWGEAVINDELQAYVDDAFTLQNGILSIVGTQASGQYAGKTMNYRSGVICSLHEQTYGYFEAKVRVPKGQGFWPAFWLLGSVGSTGVNEIDVLEILGHETNKLYMNVHWGESYTVGHKSDGASFTGPDFAGDFHVFGLEWSQASIQWTVDGVERHSHTGEGVPSVPMYIILNLAIGGGWPGAPDSTTVFPGKYDIDYVRAYKPAAADAGLDGSAGASSGGTAGAASTGGTPSTGGTTSTGGAPSTGGTTSTGGTGGPAPADSSSDDDSGCGCRVTGRSNPAFASLGLLFALALARLNLCRPRRRPARPCDP